jgi:hypothetical protein
MRTNRIFWALLLVGIGFLFLAGNLGVITINVWGLIWPVFLILLGIFFIIGTSRGPVDMVREEGAVDLEGATSATVRVKHGAGVITADSSADPGKLASGTFTNGLDARVKKAGNHLDVVMQPKRWIFPDLMLPWNWISNKGYQWDLGFTKEVPLNLVFETGAGEAQIDLTDLQVKDIKLSTGASSTEIKLPAKAGSTHVKVEAGAASVVIYVPDGVGARIESASGLASISIDTSRFPKLNGYYQSSNYEETENKADIRISSGVASIEIR